MNFALIEVKCRLY